MAFSIWVGNHIHSTTLANFLGCQDLLTCTLFEICFVSVDDENADINAFALELCLARLFQSVHISGLCFGYIVNVWAIGILDNVPFHFALRVLKRIKTLSHW